MANEIDLKFMYFRKDDMRFMLHSNVSFVAYCTGFINKSKFIEGFICCLFCKGMLFSR